jgi:hypothetical protein
MYQYESRRRARDEDRIEQIGEFEQTPVVHVHEARAMRGRG